MTPSQKYLKKIGLKDQDMIEEKNKKNNEISENSRRSFLKKSAFLPGNIVVTSIIANTSSQIFAKSLINERCLGWLLVKTVIFIFILFFQLIMHGLFEGILMKLNSLNPYWI